MVELLKAAVRSYAWGSRTAIAELRGSADPTPHPEAELWLGAHPGDPAMLAGGSDCSLLERIEADPAGQLGRQVLAKFGPRLPFLLKVLAAEEPLSLQAHPSKRQAEEGYDREDERGLPVDSPLRNYRDRNHKPEVVVALGPFEALAGFRDAATTVEVLSAIEVPELAPHIELLRGQPDEAGLRALFTTWITMPQKSVDQLLPKVMQGCVRYLTAHGGAGEYSAVMRTVLEISDTYPGDVGVLSSMLLNRVTLQDGEALYLPAGNLHAYLRGVAVEVMANSDNVLRGGLTPKHVDVPELLRVLDFGSVDAVPMLDTDMPGGEPIPGEYEYPAHTQDFRLSRVLLGADELILGGRDDRDARGPEILLCVDGAVELRCGGQRVELRPAEAAWVAASDPSVALRASTPSARVFRATVGGIGATAARSHPQSPSNNRGEDVRS